MTPGQLFEAVLAGEPAASLLPALQDLPEEDRHLLLCTVCLIREEIGANCSNRGEEIDSFLDAGCPFYVDGNRTCPRS